MAGNNIEQRLARLTEGWEDIMEERRRFGFNLENNPIQGARQEARVGNVLLTALNLRLAGNLLSPQFKRKILRQAMSTRALDEARYREACGKQKRLELRTSINPVSLF